MLLLLLLCLPLNCAERICRSPGIENFQTYQEELSEIKETSPYSCSSEYTEDHPYYNEEAIFFVFDTETDEEINV